jgi:branched-chain amino acid transport system substrate-binding protein
MRFTSTAMTGCLLAGVVASVLSACGKTSSSSTTGSGGGGGSKVVDVYSSLPMHGHSTSQAEPIVKGIKLALEQAGGKAGRWTIHYTALDDATSQAGGWDPDQTAVDARNAAADLRAVYYIGELDSGASEISIPILNQAGVPQVSPANTYVGLTTSLPGSARGEPQLYFPTRTRTYLRIVPTASIEAAADLMAMKQAGCRKVAVVNDKSADGAGLATLLELEKKYYGVNLVSNAGIDLTAPNLGFDAPKLKAERANCFFFAGSVSTGAVQVTEDAHAAIPNAKVFGGAGVCTDSFTSAAKGGLPASLDRLIECTAAAPPLASYPRGMAFLAAYKAKYGDSNPDPYAVYGYEAMKLGLDTIAGLGSQGNSKSAVLKALFATKDRRSVLGTYGFDHNGDTTVKSYGLYRVGSNGEPVFYKTLTPAKTI